MKISVAALITLPSMAAAFAPGIITHNRQQPTFTRFAVASPDVVTGPDGKPATSFEEDLLLTLRIIQDHDSRSATVSKEQFIQQQVEAIKADETSTTESVDLSIPYDAAAMLAYEASDKSMAFDAFKTKYLDETVAYIKSKQPAAKESATPAAVAAAVDLSIPYDATAKLAYDASDKSMPYEAFKTKYLEDTVAYIKSKQPAAKEPAAPAATSAVDLSIPYDATAKLAYEASDKSMPYEAFKTKYLEDTVAYIKSKQPMDLSIPYDAPAKLAYDASDKSMSYADFKTKYEADAVADVIAKRK